MSPTKKEQSAATTAHLLKIARTLFAEHGYAAVALEDLAARGQVTRGAVYHHFKSKNGLFAAVLDSVAAAVADTVEAAANTATPQNPWTQVVAGCHAFVDAACSDDNRRILLIDAPAVLGWTRWRESDARHSGRLLRAGLDAAAGERMLAVSEVEPASVMLSGAMNEAALWLARTDAAHGDSDRAHAMLDRLIAAVYVNSDR